MSHFQFTSPNAAGAKDNQAMLIAMREALQEAQQAEAKIISAAPDIALMEGEAIQNQAAKEADQMTFQAIGSIVGGATGIASTGLEGVNLRAGTPAGEMLDEADLNQSYANALEDGVTPTTPTGLQGESQAGRTGAPNDAVETPAQAQERLNKSLAAKTDLQNRFNIGDENSSLKSSAQTRQENATSYEEAIEADKTELRQKSAELTPEHRSELVKRFRNRAEGLYKRSQNLDTQVGRRSSMTQMFSQLGTAFGQAGGNFGAQSARIDAGIAQRQAEMARLTVQGRQKAEDVAATQEKSIADSLKGAVEAQRNYYSTRG